MPRRQAPQRRLAAAAASARPESARRKPRPRSAFEVRRKSSAWRRARPFETRLIRLPASIGRTPSIGAVALVRRCPDVASEGITLTRVRDILRNDPNAKATVDLVIGPGLRLAANPDG